MGKKLYWDMDLLGSVPKIYATDSYEIEGMKSFFYEGVSYKGAATKVYAYYRAPEGAAPLGGWPGVVLVHGGGGTAFPWLIDKWNQRGFAAVSMDLEGHLPDLTLQHDLRPSHNGAGPSRQGLFDDYELPIEDQWFYHAIADVVRGHSLLRSFEGVNAEQIGIVGVSWGGMITTAVVGIDPRFRFAISIYGCGFNAESDGVLRPTEDKADLWEPTSFTDDHPVNMPMLFINGTNDQHFPLDTWEKTARHMKCSLSRCIIPRMSHGHEAAYSIDTPFDFARQVIDKEKPLITFSDMKRSGDQLSLVIGNGCNINKAVLCYTKGTGKRSEREWLENEAVLREGQVTATMPKGISAYYINVIDDKGQIFSSAYKEARSNDL